MRDALVSMRDMFDRRDKYARDNIPQLERKIQQNEVKLQGIKAKGDTAKVGEAEKVENAIVNVSSTFLQIATCGPRVLVADMMFLTGQTIHRQPTRPRRVYSRVRARRDCVLQFDATSDIALASGLGAGACQVH